MAKLVEMERRMESAEGRRFVVEIQDEVMQLERNLILALGDNLKLAERLAGEKAKVQRLKDQLKRPDAAHTGANARFSTTDQVNGLLSPDIAF